MNAEIRRPRRNFLKIAAKTAGYIGFLGFAHHSPAMARSLAKLAKQKNKPKVVIVGAGFGGATVAKYLGQWGQGQVEVTLIERDREFFSCPLSNLVLGGNADLGDLRFSHAGLSSYGVRLVCAEAGRIDPDKRLVFTQGGQKFPYDRLILAPGMDFMEDVVPGLSEKKAQETVLHAWRAGPQTLALRQQLLDLPNGQNFLLHIPKAPYKCPPGPYERACQIAFYLKHHKPKSKIFVLDANPKIQSKEALFRSVWEKEYADWLEYRPDSALLQVDAIKGVLKLEFEDLSGGILNVIPPQRAGGIARIMGLNNLQEQRFCGVDFLTYESTVREKIHLLGDAIQAAPGMPKSGHMANQQAKVCAAALLALFAEQPVHPEPMLTNACYSFVDDQRAIHVASVHRFDPQTKTVITVPGSGGLSASPSVLEGQYAWGWAKNIWADTLA